MTSEQLTVPIRIFGLDFTIDQIRNIVPTQEQINGQRTPVVEYLCRRYIENWSNEPLDSNHTETISNGLMTDAAPLLDYLRELSGPGPTPYDAVASMTQVLKASITTLLNLLRDDHTSDFAMHFLHELIVFNRRFFSIISACFNRRFATKFVDFLVNFICPVPSGEL